jgi:TPR repeat protein
MMTYLQQAASEPNPHPEALLLLGNFLVSIFLSLLFVVLFLTQYQHVSEVNLKRKMFVGDVYFHGTEGIDIDYPRALYYYKKAGKYGNAEALCNVV